MPWVSTGTIRGRDGRDGRDGKDGKPGEKGETGSISSASAESIPAGKPAEVIMSGSREVKHLHIKVPRGLPGMNAVPADEGVAGYLGSTGSQSRDVLDDVIATALASLPVAMAQGRISITPSAPDVPTGATITFPVGRFTVPPGIQVTASTATPGTGVSGASAAGSSVTGATVYLTRSSTLPASVDWLAVQMKAGSANG